MKIVLSLLTILILSLSACSKKEEIVETTTTEYLDANAESSTEVNIETAANEPASVSDYSVQYDQDQSVSPTNSTYGYTDHKYESRTGTTGNYTYNYDMQGQDGSGNDVTANVDVNGKSGSGTLTDAEDNEKEVTVEWKDHGKMEATDDDGNTYELQAQ